MLNLGIIGTNWITQQFVEAGHIAGTFNLTEVYSRHLETAQKFAQSVHREEATITDNLDNFFASDKFDVVYIASPNSLHFAQTLSAIEAGKHVIVEKPAFSNPREFNQVKLALNNHPKVYLFEAARHIYDPNFLLLEERLSELDNVNGATISYMKYSSRYDQVLAGEEPNVFSPKFSGGALADLGVYTLYAAIKLFGAPERVHYVAQKIATGVDGKGTAILEYPEFNVTLLFGKNSQSHIPSEFYAHKQTLWVDNIGTMDELRFYPDYTTTDYEDLTVEHSKNPMVDEANYFGKAIENKDRQAYERALKLAEIVNDVSFKLREDAGIVFAADEH